MVLMTRGLPVLRYNGEAALNRVSSQTTRCCYFIIVELCDGRSSQTIVARAT